MIFYRIMFDNLRLAVCHGLFSPTHGGKRIDGIRTSTYRL